jgi:amino acid permease
MKTVIGVGILGLPYAVARLGWLLALIMFVVTTFLTQYGCVLLLKVKNLSHHSNYSTIGANVIKSRFFEGFIYFIVIFNNIGICKINL